MKSTALTLSDDWFVSGPQPAGATASPLPESPTSTFYRTLIDQGFDLTVVVDRSEHITFVSRSASDVLGFAPELLVGRALLSLIHLDDQAAFRAAIARTSDRPKPVRGRIRHADSTWRSIEFVVSACLDPTGAPVRVVTARDITPLRTLEDRRWRDDRIATLGQMTASIAHDFNNLLQALMLHLHCLDEDAPEQRETTEQMRAMLDSAAELTNQLLSFARGETLAEALQPVDAHDVIADTSTLLKTLVRRNVRVVYSLDADLPWIGVGRVPLAQILVNLAVNARDAMPRGGLLTIATRNTPRVVPHDLLPGCDSTRHDWFTLEVADLGCGMTADVKARIFEPFFTTKPRGQGTGLGLHTVMDIVKRAGGHVEVESAPGQGAIFRIHLPLCAAPSLETRDTA